MRVGVPAIRTCVVDFVRERMRSWPGFAVDQRASELQSRSMNSLPLPERIFTSIPMSISISISHGSQPFEEYIAIDLRLPNWSCRQSTNVSFSPRAKA